VREGFSERKENGCVIGQRILPLERVGVYVPGGTASYPSTVLMNVIPAAIAGVPEIFVTTPAGRDGKVAAPILAAARIAGATRVFKCGGASAIAALAYGTETIPAVEKITGPGNIYVALAKREVFGRVGIDMIAGPSEILVIADETADAEYVAADLLSQAEHDRLAASILICTSLDFAEKVAAALERQLALLPRADIARESIETNGRIAVVSSLSEAAELSNDIAPEHLELAVADPFALLPLIKSAGSVFLGSFTPESLGDYYAGPNHTLPTSGSARFASPLSVDDFIKKSSYIYYTQDAISSASVDIARFARLEGLEAHARAAEIRRKK
jgi:histidinol dehydrogenase